MSPCLYISQCMGKMNVVISDEIEEQFRLTIANYKGFKKGNISEALEEAIVLWINSKIKSFVPEKAKIKF
jgi:hypothetical protein